MYLNTAAKAKLAQNLAQLMRHGYDASITLMTETLEILMDVAVEQDRRIAELELRVWQPPAGYSFYCSQGAGMPSWRWSHKWDASGQHWSQSSEPFSDELECRRALRAKVEGM